MDSILPTIFVPEPIIPLDVILGPPIVPFPWVIIAEANPIDE